MLDRLRRFLGALKELPAPSIPQNLALVGILAWIGLGADGLSSTSYGPEAAYLNLGTHVHLALYLMLATVLTVFLISASYSQVLEVFPAGGGGYVVATKLLGPNAGILSGSALIVDYVLTIAISIAAGVQAIFSFLPVPLHWLALPAELLMIVVLTSLNRQGVMASVSVLVAVFVAFIVTHVPLILYGVLRHSPALPSLLADTVADTRRAVGELGLLGVLAIFLRAFSMGGGTYAGIEAVSNSTDLLREPRVETGRRAMLYMALALSFTAGGILLCDLLNAVHHEPGRTLNASLWTTLTRDWTLAGHALGPWVVALTLLAEGALLFLAVQTGYTAGPRTLAAMALDEWVPKRLAHLSEEMVTQNGVLAMGLAAALALIYTGGQVRILIVMYSINVFVTFTLSQLGMVRHWWQVRAEGGHWRRHLAVTLAGTIVTTTILAVTSVVKFREGGWVTLTATGALIGFCFLVRSHYRNVRRMLRSLDETLANVPLGGHGPPGELAVDGPTAIVLVESWGGLGIHTVLSILRMFPRHYRNFVFCSVGLLDSGQFKGARSVEALEAKVRSDLEKYVEMAQSAGAYAEYRYTLGTDLISELEAMCVDLVKEFRRCVVFAGQLVFERESLFTRSLHHETAFSIQRRLQFRGIQLVILPIRVWDQFKAA
ncbi:MAG TPA: APC family permease [Terriglobales bacterium]|nr:APC family permease [Terriglobales bacterium]